MAEVTLYKVDKKEEVRKLGKGGEPEVFYRIYATAKDGTYFHVDVPEAELGKADEKLSARAQQLIGIK